MDKNRVIAFQNFRRWELRSGKNSMTALKNPKVFLPALALLLLSCSLVIFLVFIKSEKVVEEMDGITTYTVDKAPKDLKSEVNRLAKLIGTSHIEMAAEKSAADNEKASRIKLLESQSSQLAYDIDNCYRGMGYKSASGNRGKESKCSLMEDRSLSLEAQRLDIEMNINPDLVYRKIWSQAWLDLTTLAKTFPQYFKPLELPFLLNYFETAKQCVIQSWCYPDGM
jgi:hypothetical protein